MAALTLKAVRKTYDGKQFVLHGIDVDSRRTANSS